jgi:myosin heavy subunit
MPKAVLDMYKHRGDKEFTMAALDVFEVPREYYHLGYTRLFFRPGRFTELDRILKSCKQVTAKELAAKMRSQLMRRLWRLMLCRVRVGLMWIGALRTMREKRAKAMQLLKRNLHRKKVIKDWASLIMAEGERVERERLENKAASKIALLFFDWCFRKSHLFRVKHPEGPRRKDDHHRHEEFEREMTEEEIKEHHENFQKQVFVLSFDFCDFFFFF